MKYLLIIIILITVTWTRTSMPSLTKEQKLDRLKEQEEYDSNPMRKIESLTNNELLSFIKEDLKVYVTNFDKYLQTSPWFNENPFQEYFIFIKNKRIKEGYTESIHFLGEQENDRNNRDYKNSVEFYVKHDIELLNKISNEIDISETYLFLNKIDVKEKLIKFSQLNREKHFGSHEKYLDILYSFTYENMINSADTLDLSPLYVEASLYDVKFLRALKKSKKNGRFIMNFQISLATLLNESGRITDDLLEEALNHEEIKIQAWAIKKVSTRKIRYLYPKIVKFYNENMRGTFTYIDPKKYFPFKFPSKGKRRMRPLLKRMPPIREGF